MKTKAKRKAKRKAKSDNNTVRRTEGVDARRFS